MENNEIKPVIFSYDGDELKRYIQYEMKTLSHIKKSFKYVHSKMLELGHGAQIAKTCPSLAENNVNLDKFKWKEGKNYDWLALSIGEDVKLLFRRYGTHFTIYTSYYKTHVGKNKLHWPETVYGVFTFYSNCDLLSDKDSDFYYQNAAYDLNKTLNKIVEMVCEGNVWMAWNSSYLPRPEHVEMKVIYSHESIHSIDQLIFCCEELSQINLCLFAENNMLEKIKTYVPGDKIGDKIVKEIRSEVKDDYYHAVGIQFTDGEYMKDVYYLSRWMIDAIFPEAKLRSKKED